MSTTVEQVGAGWAVLALLLLIGFATVLASVHAMADGHRWSLPVVESARLLRQRRRTVLAADDLLWRSGGAGLLVAALLMVAVVPLGSWTVADVSVGLVWFNAMDVMVWALVWLLGWGANSTFGLIGGYRFLALALAYELPLMFALTAPAVASSSLRVGDVVAAQSDLWFVVWMPVAFVVYCLSVTGFAFFGPLSTAAAPDLAGGVMAELSGVDRLVVQVGRYALLVAGAAFAVPLFLGGGAGPFLPSWAWVLVKVGVLAAGLVVVAARVPMLRPERFAEIGWLVLLPLTLVQVLVVSLIVVVP